MKTLIIPEALQVLTDWKNQQAMPSKTQEMPRFDESMQMLDTLREKPIQAGKQGAIRQHQKNRMTVWERLDVLCGGSYTLLHPNWGKHLDGASIVTAIAHIGGRDVGVYAHDFTVRAGSLDESNGKKLKHFFDVILKHQIPLIGLNDSAGAYVPAGVGGLDSYSLSFLGLRNLSGVVPSLMCMFGFNAGGGSYLPRQGSFIIQPRETFFGLTGVSVIKNVLGEEVTPDELGGPDVHAQSGVTDYIVEDEVEALSWCKTLLTILPDNNRVSAPFHATTDPIDRPTQECEGLLRRAINSPTGYNTPFDISVMVADICDDRQTIVFQPNRARNSFCAWGRLGGHVVGFCANNSAVASGQIDIEAAYKKARFIRFCNLYNIPLIFMEDTTGFLPGKEQEKRGVVQAGRAMLDAILDLRVPRILVLVRNAFGGAYASFNNYATGADWVIALPTTRAAVMGTAGVEFVYKEEMKKIVKEKQAYYRSVKKQHLSSGMVETLAEQSALEQSELWYKAQYQILASRYERELLNPKEALSLGSISEIVSPSALRRSLGQKIAFYMRHYTPTPMVGVQREFH